MPADGILAVRFTPTAMSAHPVSKDSSNKTKLFHAHSKEVPYLTGRDTMPPKNAR
jgi:hypothetical protein